MIVTVCNSLPIQSRFTCKLLTVRKSPMTIDVGIWEVQRLSILRVYPSVEAFLILYPTILKLLNGDSVTVRGVSGRDMRLDKEHSRKPMKRASI